MNSADDFAAQQAAILSIPADAIKKPSIPIKIYVQEAENLAKWCLQDQAALVHAGLDWQVVLDLPQRVGALREAESRWFKERFSREEAQQEWEQKAPRAYALRDGLLRDMRFAYRKDEALLKRVADIAEGTGHADMIQDLNDIATLGRDFSAPLSAVGVDLLVLDQAADTAAEMGELLALVNGEKAENNSARVVRDQAYTHLKAAVDDVREHGQYVFWDNELRRDGYVSHYLRNVRSAGAKQSAPQAEPSAV